MTLILSEFDGFVVTGKTACMYYGLCSDEAWDRHLSGVGASHTSWLNSVLSSHSAEMREQATKTEEEEVVARATGLA
jgi:hypothetical protein